MFHRGLVLVALAGLAMLIGLSVTLFVISRARRLSRDRFEQVQTGMSFEQVVATVGAQPGNYVTCRYWPHKDSCRLMAYTWWACDEGELLVRFDDNNIANAVIVRNVFLIDPPTPLERLREWLHLD
jgi:hypothetical protein